MYPSPFSCPHSVPLLSLTGDINPGEEWTIDTREAALVFKADGSIGLNGFMISVTAVG